MESTAHIDGSGNIIIQNIDGSTININPNNVEDLKQLILDYQDKIENLPLTILKMINERQDINHVPEKGANIYMTTLLQTSGYGFEGMELKFGITITNLMRENRYFNQPFFKVTPPMDFGRGIVHDTFSMLENETGVSFPYKLEYGQPISIVYGIKSKAMENYKMLFEKDSEATLQCFSSTTVGDLFESNIYKVRQLIEALNIKK